MSAGVSDQRMKGQGNQVNNGPKEQLGEGGVGTGGVSEDFESWRSQQQAQQGGAAPAPYAASVPISSATDPYNMNTAAGYYGSGGTFPYQAFGVGDGTWSNGTDAMTFLGGYTHESFAMDGMFGPSTTFSTTAFGQPSAYNYFPGNGDYSTWGTQINQRKPHYDDYYRPDTQNMYAATQTMQDSNLALKSVEQNMQNLNIDMSNVHMNTQIGHNCPQLGKGDGKDTKSSTSDLKESNLGSVQPKKMTWASIASQPAKPQVTIQSSGLKKKGPGMPPGPIVPGKHNMDIGTWDTNKSVPPQLSVVNSAPPPPKNIASNINVMPAWPGPVRAQTGQPQNQQMVRPQVQQQQQQQQQQQHQQQHQQQQQQQQQHQQPPQHQPPHHHQQPHQQPQQQQHQPPPQSANMQQHYMQQMPPHSMGMSQHIPLPSQGMPPPQSQQMMLATPAPSHPVLDELRVKNNYNPPDFELTAPGARFFVIKSYSEDDIHRSIKYEIWCSTEHGNKRLDQAFREREKEPNGCVYLFFSVNGSGHFCGMAQMVSSVDYNSNSSVWSQDKWKGQFRVRWIYVKDVPNVQFRHIRLQNNENKPVTNSRDTQEVLHANGLQVLRILHFYKHSTSIFDDFIHYEKRQEEEDNRKIPEPLMNQGGGSGSNNNGGGRDPSHHMNRDNHHGGAGGGGNRENNHHSARENHHHSNSRGNENHHSGRDNMHHGNGGPRDNPRDRDHRERRNMDRESMHDNNHRSSNQRNHDLSHHKDRGENNRVRGGRGGRN